MDELEDLDNSLDSSNDLDDLDDIEEIGETNVVEELDDEKQMAKNIPAKKNGINWKWKPWLKLRITKESKNHTCENKIWPTYKDSWYGHRDVM